MMDWFFTLIDNPWFVLVSVVFFIIIEETVRSQKKAEKRERRELLDKFLRRQHAAHL